MQWSATFEFAPLWANIMESSNLKSVLYDSQSKVKAEEFIQNSQMAQWCDLQGGQFYLGIFRAVGLQWCCHLQYEAAQEL